MGYRKLLQYLFYLSTTVQTLRHFVVVLLKFKYSYETTL